MIKHQDSNSYEVYDCKQEQAIKEFADNFNTDVHRLAKMYIEHFFKDKTMHCGGKIPKTCLFSEKRIKKVLNYDISTGVQCAYKHLEPLLSEEEIFDCQRTGESTKDIKLVTGVLHLMSRSGVPQQFAGGMMLLYLEFVEGISFYE